MLIKKSFKKRKVCFRRLLHAVGQGAFFTEQFFVDGKSDLNVIYDCGSLSKKGILDAEIKRTFAYDKTKSIHYYHMKTPHPNSSVHSILHQIQFHNLPLHM